MQQKPMARFARHRTLTEVLKLAAEKGYKVDAIRHTQRGSDHIVVHMPGKDGTLIPVLFNVFNGRFFHSGPTPFSYFTSDETVHEGQPWFDAMLAFFYVDKVPA